MIEIKPLELDKENGKTNYGFDDIDLNNSDSDKTIKIELEDHIEPLKTNEDTNKLESIEKQIDIPNEKDLDENINEIEDKEADKEDNDHIVSHLIIQMRMFMASQIKNVFFFSLFH